MPVKSVSAAPSGQSQIDRIAAILHCAIRGRILVATKDAAGTQGDFWREGGECLLAKLRRAAISEVLRILAQPCVHTSISQPVGIRGKEVVAQGGLLQKPATQVARRGQLSGCATV